MMRAPTLIALLVAACSGSAGAPNTAIVVSIDSELRVPSELARVEVSVLDGDHEEPVSDADFTLSADGRAPGTTSLPFSFEIERGSTDAFALRVVGIGPLPEGGQGVVIEREVHARFVRGRTLALPVVLWRECHMKLCDGATTCEPNAADGCSPPPTLADLMDWDGDLPRAIEVGAPPGTPGGDAGVDEPATDHNGEQEKPPFPATYRALNIVSLTQFDGTKDGLDTKREQFLNGLWTFHADGRFVFETIETRATNGYRGSYTRAGDGIDFSGEASETQPTYQYRGVVTGDLDISRTPARITMAWDNVATTFVTINGTMMSQEVTSQHQVILTVAASEE